MSKKIDKLIPADKTNAKSKAEQKINEKVIQALCMVQALVDDYVIVASSVSGVNAETIRKRIIDKGDEALARMKNQLSGTIPA